MYAIFIVETMLMMRSPKITMPSLPIFTTVFTMSFPPLTIDHKCLYIIPIRIEIP